MSERLTKQGVRDLDSSPPNPTISGQARRHRRLLNRWRKRDRDRQLLGLAYLRTQTGLVRARVPTMYAQFRATRGEDVTLTGKC